MLHRSSNRHLSMNYVSKLRHKHTLVRVEDNRLSLFYFSFSFSFIFLLLDFGLGYSVMSQTVTYATQKNVKGFRTIMSYSIFTIDNIWPLK